ncbi:MAG: hypothetical protein FJW40_08740 [Acidobacteria bacterium]|nr:hypothetical protein [Acidobacteriota bacterium]
MALFTDNPLRTVADLHQYEAGVLETANVESIDLTAKLVLAQGEIGNQVALFLIQRGVYQDDGIRAALSHVAVTPPLEQWHAYHTLAMIYRDAFHSQYNDRYQPKWKEYERQADLTGTLAFQTGIGIVPAPLPRPSQPPVDRIAGAVPNGSYMFQVTWANSIGEESAPSEALLFETNDGSAAQFRVENAPALATGWNLYAAPAGETPTRQNSLPLGLSETWTLPPDALAAGPVAGTGQAPVYYVRSEFRR